jgi:ribonuclease P protein component
MLPIQFRLKNKRGFSEVFRRGQTISNEVLIIKCEKIENGGLKVGFSAGMKFSKKSSERNKVKRWMREAVRPLLGKIKTGYQVIFLINSKFPYKQINHSLIKEKTEDLLTRAKLLK